MRSVYVDSATGKLLMTIHTCSVEKFSEENINFVIITSGQIKKYYITAGSRSGIIDSPFPGKIHSFLNSKNAEVLSHMVFGNTAYAETAESLDWPVTWLQGDTCSCGKISSAVITAVSGTDINYIYSGGKRRGAVYSDKCARYCYLGNIHSENTSASPAEQAKNAYEIMHNALKTAGMDFSDTVRMWNYLDNLLDWYDEFNRMRTAFFTEHNVFNGTVPAGTGIGASNPAGAAYVGELIAVKPLSEKSAASAIPSPMQCPAINYRSSFSRAVEIRCRNAGYLSISGTASIAQDGSSVNIDDTAAQIELTMQVVKAILESRNMDWDNTLKAIAYFKDIKDLTLFKDYLDRHRLHSLPVAVSHAAICRDDLLFELELDAHRTEN